MTAIVRPLMSRTWPVLLFALLLTAACSSPHGLHSNQLLLTGQAQFVVPSFARKKDGHPFSGRAYGTFFGDSSLDCVEWEGQFVNGAPDGDFFVYDNCSVAPKRILFKHGVRVTRPVNSSWPNRSDTT